MASNRLPNVNILSILKHPDLPESILQYLDPRDVHSLCTINNVVWRVMTSDLTILKRYYWFYYGPILSLLRLEDLPYLRRCGLDEEIRTFEEVFDIFLHKDEVRDCVALHLYFRTMVQSRRMYMKILLRHLLKDGNNVIKWCQLGRKLLHHVTPKMFIKSTLPQFIQDDYEIGALKQFCDAIGWLKVFDGPLFTLDERRSAFWAVIQKFDWSEHTYMIALCSMMTPRDLQMLADCDMDDILRPDHSVERAKFLMCLGSLLKSSQEQFIDYFSRLMLRTISCAVSQTRSYQLEAVIKILSGVSSKTVWIEYLDEELVDAFGDALMHIVIQMEAEQSRTAGRSVVRSHLIRFLTQSFPSDLLMKLVDSGFQQFLHLNMTNARMIQFYIKIWHCLPQHLPGIPLELRRQWVSSLITELIGRYDEVSDNFGGFSTIVFGQCYQTFLSEEFCPVIVSAYTELCGKEAPEYSQWEAEQLFEDLYESDFGDEFPTLASVTWPLKKHVEALQSEAGTNKCGDAVVQQLQQLFEVYEKRNKDGEHYPQND
ncbi:hypothetical protein MIR68_012234 [Amoeboaphelidium protococcarum]|nr:hypothetical protein MIR68_012234 [Amoeboaphelidium protococcarum]